MTFDDFKASGRDCKDVGAELKDTSLVGVPGHIYCYEDQTSHLLVWCKRVGGDWVAQGETNGEGCVGTLEECEEYMFALCREEHDGEPFDGFLSDTEADADALASAGWGTDEDYGLYDGGDF